MFKLKYYASRKAWVSVFCYGLAENDIVGFQSTDQNETIRQNVILNDMMEDYAQQLANDLRKG